MTQEQARKLAHDWYQCLVSQVNGRKPEEMRVLTEHNIAMLNLDSHKIPRQSAGGEDLTLWNRVVLLVQAETDKVRVDLMERFPKPPLVVPEDGKEGIYPGKRYKPISDEEYKTRMDGSTRWREPDPTHKTPTPEQRRSIADAYYQGVYAKRLETKNAENDD